MIKAPAEEKKKNHLTLHVSIRESFSEEVTFGLGSEGSIGVCEKAHDTKEGSSMHKEMLMYKDMYMQRLCLDGGAEHLGLDLDWTYFISSPGARGHVS